MSQTTALFIPKRYRYYWEKRPENRTRKLVMQITIPRIKGRKNFDEIYTKKEKSIYELDKLYGLDNVIHNEVKDVFSNYKFIAVCLMSPMPEEEYFTTRHELKKVNIFMEDFPEHVVHYTLKNTRYSNFLTLYQHSTVTLFSNNGNYKEMMKILRMNPYLLPLGGMMEDRYLSPKALTDFAKLPDLDHSRAELCRTLSSVLASSKNLLQTHQSRLTMSLDQYIRDNTNDSSG